MLSSEHVIVSEVIAPELLWPPALGLHKTEFVHSQSWTSLEATHGPLPLPAELLVTSGFWRSRHCLQECSHG